jgi:hypothetical protein
MFLIQRDLDILQVMWSIYIYIYIFFFFQYFQMFHWLLVNHVLAKIVSIHYEEYLLNAVDVILRTTFITLDALCKYLSLYDCLPTVSFLGPVANF